MFSYDFDSNFFFPGYRSLTTLGKFKFVRRGIDNATFYLVFSDQDTAGSVLTGIAPMNQNAVEMRHVQKARKVAAEARRTVYGYFVSGKSSVSCPLKPSDSAPLC